MNKFITTLLVLTAFNFTYGQSVFGKWKTVDDQTGEVKSVVEIYEDNGKTYGKIVEILHPDPQRQKTLCSNCKDERKDKPILGMVIINGLVKKGNKCSGGKILDPESGKEYKCYIELVESNKLKVRGYIGFSLLGRTQYWFKEE